MTSGSSLPTVKVLKQHETQWIASGIGLRKNRNIKAGGLRPFGPKPDKPRCVSDGSVRLVSGSDAASSQISDDAVHYIDLGDVNAGLDAPISRMLASILPNESASPAKPARAVVERFIDVWRTGILACQARAASLKGQFRYFVASARTS
jgi:hypothetical protein